MHVPTLNQVKEGSQTLSSALTTVLDGIEDEGDIFINMITLCFYLKISPKAK